MEGIETITCRLNVYPLPCHQLVLKVWARQFSKLSGAKAPPAEAQVFQAYVRVPASAPGHLFRLPNEGIDFEAREGDGSGPHRTWAVVWLPGADRVQAHHAQRTCDRALGLARIGSKYGIRQRSRVRNTPGPHHEFSKVRILHRYRAHPLPFGAQRSTVAPLIRG